MIGFLKKGKDPKKPAKIKNKKEKKGKGSKGDSSRLIDSMGLQESVASMILDELRDNDRETSLVRELSDGYLVLALTEDALKSSGVSLKDEQFGSFSESIASEHVRAIVFADDLSDGTVGIIPSFDTLDVLNEYEFLYETSFEWALVPYDAGDDSTLIMLNESSTLDEIMDMAYGETPLPDFGEEAVDESEDMDGYDVSFDDGDIVDDDDVVDDLDDEPIDDFPLDDETTYVSMDIPTDDDDLYVDSPVDDLDDDTSMDEAFDDNDDDYSYKDDSEEYVASADVSTMDEGLVAQEVEGLTSRTFYNDELGLSINLDAFDMHFDNIESSMPLFDETVTDNSELSANLANMRRDANIELMRYRSKHMQELRSQYALILSSAHDTLVESLDYRNTDTTVGKQYKEIERERYHELSEADTVLHKKRSEMSEEYNKRREDAAIQAANIAREKYDAIHHQAFDVERRSLEELVRSQIEVDADLRVSKLHDERKELAQRLYDKTVTMTLKNMQDAFSTMAQDEMDMYDMFRKRLDHYLRNNYTNEVLRAQAIAEQQRQSNETVLLKERYDAMMAQKQAEVDTADMKATNRLRELEKQQSESLKEARGDFERRLEEYKQRNAMLESSVSALQKDLSKMDELKSNEFKNQLRSKDDIIASQREQLSYAEERASKTAKTSGGVLASFVAVALVFGVGCGVAIGVLTSGSKDTPVVQAPQQQPQQTFVIPGYAPTPTVQAEETPTTVVDSQADTEKNETVDASDKEKTDPSSETTQAQSE